ncbi:MAG: class I SAM-dependent methyltransferase [Marinicella sp.]
MEKYQETLRTFDAVAEKYWDKFKDFELYQPTYDWFCELLPTGSLNLLEVACGPGNVSRYLLNKNPNMNLIGIDLAPNMIAQAIRHNPTAIYKIMDCLSIQQLEQNFEAIMCGFCLPYLNEQDAYSLLDTMIGMLKPNGILYISTTSGEAHNEGYQSSKSSPGSVYVHYHDIESIKQRLLESGMTISKHEQIIHQHNEQETIDEFILAVNHT